MASLNWNMDEAINARVIEKLCDCVEMIQHIGWVGHSDSHHNSVMVFQFFTKGD